MSSQLYKYQQTTIGIEQTTIVIEQTTIALLSIPFNLIFSKPQDTITITVPNSLVISSHDKKITNHNSYHNEQTTIHKPQSSEPQVQVAMSKPQSANHNREFVIVIMIMIMMIQGSSNIRSATLCSMS